jgi:hypothetical protein
VDEFPVGVTGTGKEGVEQAAFHAEGPHNKKGQVPQPDSAARLR